MGPKLISIGDRPGKPGIGSHRPGIKSRGVQPRSWGEAHSGVGRTQEREAPGAGAGAPQPDDGWERTQRNEGGG